MPLDAFFSLYEAMERVGQQVTNGFRSCSLAVGVMEAKWQKYTEMVRMWRCAWRNWSVRLEFGRRVWKEVNESVRRGAEVVEA